MTKKEEFIESLVPTMMEIGDTMFYLVLKNSSKIQDLNITQLKVLKLLNFKENLKMKDIAKELSINSSGATYTADSLIKKQLIERYRSEEDRRVVLVKITEKGRDIVRSMNEVKGRIWTKILKNFSEKEIQEFSMAIKNVYKVIISVRNSKNLDF